jgi:hypothetical protein
MEPDFRRSHVFLSFARGSFSTGLTGFAGFKKNKGVFERGYL